MFEVARLGDLVCLIVGHLVPQCVSISVGQNSQVGRFKRHGGVPCWFNKRGVHLKLLYWNAKSARKQGQVENIQ